MRKSGGEAWPDMWEQWEHSQHSNHPLIEPPHVEAAMKQTVQAAEAQGPNLSSMTSHVISTLKRSRDQMESETRDWFDYPHMSREHTLTKIRSCRFLCLCVCSEAVAIRIAMRWRPICAPVSLCSGSWLIHQVGVRELMTNMLIQFPGQLSPSRN